MISRRRSCLLWAWALSAVLGFLVCSCGRPPARPDSAPRDLFVTTSDGVRLAVTVYPVAVKNPPGLVLVHMMGSDRHAWAPLARRAQQAGYLCAAFDVRGHGESVTRSGEKISYRNFSTQEWLGALNDIEAARQVLLENGADPDNLALVGASLGANLALHYAVDHPDIAALVLVAPGLDYKGIKTETAITAFGERPSLLLTSEGDSYSASSCTALKRAASGLCELREYPGATHGTALFDASASALEQVFLWLNHIFGTNRGKDEG